MIQEAKKSIDLASIVQAAGVERNRNGMALCPFHSEKTPSFKVYPDNRFKCFGCGAHGDVIDFVQKLYSFSFQDALKHLGIEQGRITPEIRKNIEKRKRRAELVKKFRKWELRYGAYVGDLIFKTEKLMERIAPEDLDLYASLLHGLPIWYYHQSILLSRSDELKFELFKDLSA